MPRKRLPVSILLALTLGPALMIGATLWLVTGLVPDCTVTEKQRLTAPDGQFDLVTFSRDCGKTETNIQAALVPAGEAVPFDAASFVSVAAAADLAPHWDTVDRIEITLPPAGEVLRRDDSVAGIDVTYR